jgi:hypothetical protein
LVAAVFLKPD